MCLEDPGAKVGRPQDFSFAGDGGRSLTELISAPSKTHDHEVEVLQGVWKFSVCQSQWWPVWRPTTKAEYPFTAQCGAAVPKVKQRLAIRL